MLHDKEYKEVDVDVEVQIPVTGKYKDTEHVRFKTESAVTAASMIFEGPYEQFSEVYSAIALWVDENGYEFCGAMMDPYHVSPHETQNPMEWVTEVCCPIRRRHEDQPFMHLMQNCKGGTGNGEPQTTILAATEQNLDL